MTTTDATSRRSGDRREPRLSTRASVIGFAIVEAVLIFGALAWSALR